MSIFSRKTPINQSVLAALAQAQGPITEADLRQKLGQQGIVAHKTTLYRQLEKLSQAGLIEITRFFDGVTRYERKKKHHHHVICKSCERVEDVETDTHLQEEEKRIAKRTGYYNITHALEFYGVCQACISLSPKLSKL